MCRSIRFDVDTLHCVHHRIRVCALRQTAHRFTLAGKAAHSEEVEYVHWFVIIIQTLGLYGCCTTFQIMNEIMFHRENKYDVLIV